MLVSSVFGRGGALSQKVPSPEANVDASTCTLHAAAAPPVDSADGTCIALPCMHCIASHRMLPRDRT